MKIHCLSVALCALALAASTGLVPAAIYTVTTTADSGSGSLRQAIVSANNNPGLNTIRFNIPGTGAQTVAPATAFPDILNPVTIDGYSQPGSSANTLTNGNNAVLLIRLDGAGIGDRAVLHRHSIVCGLGQHYRGELARGGPGQHGPRGNRHRGGRHLRGV